MNLLRLLRSCILLFSISCPTLSAFGLIFMTRVKTSRCFALILEKSRLHVDSKSYSTSTGFADVVTWRNSSSSFPDFLLSGSRWPPPSGLEYKADPHVPLHMTINPSCDRFPLGWILLKRSYIERRWVFFFFFFFLPFYLIHLGKGWQIVILSWLWTHYLEHGEDIWFLLNAWCF